MANQNPPRSHGQKYFSRTSGKGSYLEKRYGIQIRSLIIQNILGDLKGCSILDVGCGDGSLSLQYAFNKNHLTFIDTSEQMLELARSNTPRELKKEYIYENIDFLEFRSDKKYDLILLIGVLAHISSPRKAIEKINLLLNPNGICILQFSDSRNLLTKLTKINVKIREIFGRNNYYTQLNELSFPEIESIVLENNLEIKKKYQFSIMLPLMGKLSDNILFSIQKMIYKTPWLSKFGSDVIISLSKQNTWETLSTHE